MQYWPRFVRLRSRTHFYLLGIVATGNSNTFFYRTFRVLIIFICSWSRSLRDYLVELLIFAKSDLNNAFTECSNYSSVYIFALAECCNSLDLVLSPHGRLENVGSCRSSLQEIGVSRNLCCMPELFLLNTPGPGIRLSFKLFALLLLMTPPFIVLKIFRL
jgi:hypothetical protein